MGNRTTRRQTNSQSVLESSRTSPCPWGLCSGLHHCSRSVEWSRGLVNSWTNQLAKMFDIQFGVRYIIVLSAWYSVTRGMYFTGRWRWVLFQTDYIIYTLPWFDRVRVRVRVRFNVQILVLWRFPFSCSRPVSVFYLFTNITTCGRLPDTDEK